MSDRVHNVLFLCTGNSARSIMAEAMLNRLGSGKFRAFSAGALPTGEVHPMTLRLLKELHYRPEDYFSKSWGRFVEWESPRLDFVFTLCDHAKEYCPVWPRQPMTAHWGVENPAAFRGSDDEKYQFFREIYLELEHRIKLFVNLPLSELDKMSLQKHLREIGTSRR